MKDSGYRWQPDRCAFCKGTGIDSRNEAECQNCHGFGRIYGGYCPVCHGRGFFESERLSPSACPVCKGTGQIVREERSAICATCQGTGHVIDFDYQCPDCSGSGVSNWKEQKSFLDLGDYFDEFFHVEAARTQLPRCGTCRGTGTLRKESRQPQPCPSCFGTGWAITPRQIQSV